MPCEERVLCRTGGGTYRAVTGEGTEDPGPSLLLSAGDSKLSAGEGGSTECSAEDSLRREDSGVADCEAEDEATGERVAGDPGGGRGEGGKPRERAEARTGAVGTAM